MKAHPADHDFDREAPTSQLRVLAPLAVTALLLAHLLCGCCEDCDCTQPTPPDPSKGLVDTWQCVSYLLNGEPQEGQIGALMTYNDDGTGYVSDPSGTQGGDFNWAATDSMVYIEVQEMGLATSFHYTITGDSLTTYAEVSMFGPLVTYDMVYLRWEEPVE